MESYISKDYVTNGSYVVLDKDRAWNMIDKRMRTAIRKAEKYKPVVKEVKGDAKDMMLYSEFCLYAETLPKKIAKDQKMFFAYLDGKVMAGLILNEIEGNLFLRFNAVREEARKKQLSSYLIWRIVEIFSGSEFKYLDIGASYRRNLQKFFIGWQNKNYPVLMKPPAIKPQLNITPFDARHLGISGDRSITKKELKKKWKGREYTIFPRGMYAIYSLIKWLRAEGELSANDEICIKTTSGSPYISGCVTSAIEANCKWSREVNAKTRAIFVIHEFGFSHPEIEELRIICDKKKIPLIEDCAYAWESGNAGRYGDYLIYSASKIFPMQFGGILVGKKFDEDYIWDNFTCLDVGKEDIVKDQMARYLGRDLEENKKKRVDNYKYYLNIFGEERSFFKLAKGVVPGAFVLKVKDKIKMQEIKEYLPKYGIECGAFWHNDAVFLPVHQYLEKPHLDYIIGAVMATFRDACGVCYLPIIK